MGYRFNRRFRRGRRGGAAAASFVDHPRLVSAAQISAVSAKRVSGSDGDYNTLKSRVDYVATVSGANFGGALTTLNGTINSSTTTIVVADGSVFPSGSAFDIVIGLETIRISSRSGNTLTASARGSDSTNNPYTGGAYTTVAAAHTSGEPVYQFFWGDCAYYAKHAGLLYQGGAGASYGTICRHSAACLGVVLDSRNGSGNPLHWHQDRIRGEGSHFVEAIDLAWPVLTTDEQTRYSQLLADFCDAHLTQDVSPDSGAKWRYPQLNNPRFAATQIALDSNIAAGQLYTCLISAVVSHGVNADAQADLDFGLDLVNTYQVPSVLSGPFYGAMTVEGTDYINESWGFYLDTLKLMETATGGTDTTHRAALRHFSKQLIKLVIYLTLPGSTNSSTTTTATGSSGSRTITVNNNTSWSVGDFIADNTGAVETNIAAISGTTFTLADPLAAAISGATVSHISRFLPLGDGLQASGHAWYTQVIHCGRALMQAVKNLSGNDDTYAGYGRHWLDTIAPTAAEVSEYFGRTIFNDSTISAVNYRTAPLPLSFSTELAASVGLMVGRSSWTDTSCTYVAWQVGKEGYDHAHSNYGGYFINRRGIELSGEISGYAGTEYPAPADTSVTARSCWIGARVHNTLELRDVGGNASNGISAELVDDSVFMDANTTGSWGFYGGANLSGHFKSSVWTSYGWPANTPSTYYRDVFFLNALEVFVVFDWTVITGSAVTSPTKVFTQFPDAPSVSAGVATLDYGAQGISVKFCAPASVTQSTVDIVAETPTLHSAYNTRRPWNRVETVSGASATSEYFAHVVRVGAAGFTPPTSTLLVNDSNALVVQVGDQVVGRAKGTTPSLPFSFTKSGTVNNYRIGRFAASTAYHVSNVGDVYTVATATGSGDTTTDAAGLLVF